ncbi:MAG: MFS transporter [Dehalococcoidia bacterium]
MRIIEDIRVLRLHRSPSIQVVFGSSMLMIMGTSLIYPILPVISSSLGIADAHIGLVLTVFTLPSVFLSPLVGFLSDLKGRKAILVPCLLIYGAAGLAIAFVDSLPWLLALRTLQGIGYAGIMPLAIVLIGDMFTDRQETSAQGVKVVLDRATLLALPPLAGLLGAIAWQVPFALYAIAIPMALVAFLWLPESVDVERERAPMYVKQVFRVSMKVRSLVIFSMSSMRFFLEMAFFVYVPLFALDQLGVSVSRGGILFSVFAIGSIATAGIIGVLAARFDNVPLVLGSFLLQAASLLIASLASNIWVLGLAMLAFGLTNGVISPVQKSLLTQTVPRQLRGGFVSADRIAQNAAKSVAPLVAGAIVALWGIPAMFQAMALLTVLWTALVVALHVSGAMNNHGSGAEAVRINS